MIYRATFSRILNRVQSYTECIHLIYTPPQMNKFRQRLFDNQLTYPKKSPQKDCLPR